jgi:hypothetical protein
MASLVPDPMEKWALALASPSRTLLPSTQRLLRIIGKLRQIERLVRTLWPCRNQPKICSMSAADSASDFSPSPARAKVSGSVSNTQVERPASYW